MLADRDSMLAYWSSYEPSRAARAESSHTSDRHSHTLNRLFFPIALCRPLKMRLIGPTCSGRRLKVLCDLAIFPESDLLSSMVANLSRIS